MRLAQQCRGSCAGHGPAACPDARGERVGRARGLLAASAPPAGRRGRSACALRGTGEPRQQIPHVLLQPGQPLGRFCLAPRDPLVHAGQSPLVLLLPGRDPLLHEVGIALAIISGVLPLGPVREVAPQKSRAIGLWVPDSARASVTMSTGVPAVAAQAGAEWPVHARGDVEGAEYDQDEE